MAVATVNGEERRCFTIASQLRAPAHRANLRLDAGIRSVLKLACVRFGIRCSQLGLLHCPFVQRRSHRTRYDKGGRVGVEPGTSPPEGEALLHTVGGDRLAQNDRAVLDVGTRLPATCEVDLQPLGAV